jgi:type IV pilus assembly protein PilN
LLAELARQLPAGVLLTKASQTDQTVLISGTAQSNAQVADFLRNLASESAWLSKPELLESVAAPMALSGKEQRTFFNFSLKAVLNRAFEATSPNLSAVSGGAPGADRAP